jgi:ParB family chromosome partitioning protein
VLAALPIDKVDPTPYQRDLSETHAKRLASAMERVDYYLDPMIAVRHGDRYWTPNGNHRLGACKLLGEKTVMALVLPDEQVAFQILALNTEKAHNLKERSLEVIRMLRGMVGAGDPRKETEVAPLFEEAAFETLGAAYEQRPRYSGGAYHPVVKRCDEFLAKGLEEALKIREARAKKLLALDDKVVEIVNGLKAHGLTSPYLKSFVVARLNFLRFKPGATFDFDETIDKMTASAGKFDVAAVKKEDLARMGGAPAEGGGDEE